MKKAVFGIDGNEANVVHKVGVSVYTLNLIKYFHSQASQNQQFIVYLRTPPLAELPKESEYFHYKVVQGPVLWSQLFLPLHLWIYKFFGNTLTAFFAPAHYIPRFCPFKTVVTIHDLSYLYFPTEFLKKDLFQLKNWTEYALKNSKHIIAVSKTTKKDIVHEYGIPDEKISVIYNGYTNPIHAPAPHKHKVQHPYFLYIGTVQPRKNLTTLITAFTKFYETHKEYQLIIAGKKGWLYESIFEHVEKLEMKQSILFPGFVSDEEKDDLYKNASAFILPSLYEGFGIPILEAMAHGCPVVSSFSSSLPEIGGEACLYFDPRNSDDLVDKMNSIITDKELVKKLVALGKKRTEFFSWEEAGKNTLHILQSINE